MVRVFLNLGKEHYLTVDVFESEENRTSPPVFFVLPYSRKVPEDKFQEKRVKNSFS